MTIEDGVHDGMCFGEYRSVDAINNSLLSWFAKCPALCRLRVERPLEPTDAMILGQAAHAAFLEPDELASRFAVLRYDGRTKAGKEERERAAARGLQAIRAKDMETAQAIAASAFTHPRVRSLLSQPHTFEQTAVWTVGDTRRKARRDIVGRTWLAEFKTTSNVDRFSPWVITDQGYHRQAAWYSSANEVLGLGPVDHFFFVVVETTEPYPSAVFRLSDEAMEQGREEVEELLRGYLKCAKSGVWPRHVEPLLVADVARRG